MTSAHRIRPKGLLALFASLVAATALAAPPVEQKGVGDIEYKRRITTEVRNDALQAALRNAVETWVAEKQQSQYRNYEKVKGSIDANIEDYVLSHTIISSDEDKKAKRYRVVLRARLNEPRLLSAMLGPSGAAAGAENVYLAFMFVAREQVGTESATEKEATQTKEQTQGVARQRAENAASQTKSRTQTVAVRNSERTMRDRMLWDVATSNEVDAAMGDVFTDANYLVIDASIVGSMTGNTLNTDDFVSDYRTGNDITATTKREAYGKLANLRGTDDEIQYFAIGTLDVEASERDEQTGNHRVAVAVTGEVWSVFQRGATVAEVGPVTMIGEGPTELVAKNNALKAASRRAASDLVAKLSARNIR